MTGRPQTDRPLTGKHVLALFLAFFGTIIAVNLWLMTSARRSFSGTVVDNSYVASQQYNRWLAQARAQEALGWAAAAQRGRDGHAELRFSGVVPDQVQAEARHVLGRAADVRLTLDRGRDGVWRSRQTLMPGRWHIHTRAMAQGREGRWQLEAAQP